MDTENEKRTDEDQEEETGPSGLTSEEAASKFGATLASAPKRFQVYSKTLELIITSSRAGIVWLAILLILFILHQLFVWVDRDPEKAFDQAALGVEIAEIVWDSSRTMLNAAVDVFNAGIIPIWNAGTFYIVEPSIMLVIEIFSMVFTGEAYTGVIDSSSYTYNGIDCTSSAQAAEWCGAFSSCSAL